MGFKEKLEENRKLLILDAIFILLIGVVHLIFYFFIKQSDFENLFDTYESSPLFNLNIRQSENCGSQSPYTFQVWEGVKEKLSRRGSHSGRSIVDKTDLNQLNGHLFCYDYKSYRELLYNGQITKNGNGCPSQYEKNCGIIDTLNQHLCIEQDEKCPTYDLGLGDNKNSESYEYIDEAKVYYSKNDDKYIEDNKKIIGKVILNEGQPCYRLSEKLWRKFISKEAVEEHLECELEILGKTIDERFDKKGDITYYKIYEDNIPKQRFDKLKDKLKDYKVSLYSRVFLGIDKECDEKYNINKDDYDNLKKNQKMEQICIFVESIIILISYVIFILAGLAVRCTRKIEIELVIFMMLFLPLLAIFTCIICQSVFLGKIIYYNISYDCSDNETNEVLKEGNLNTKKTIAFTAINLVLDILAILANTLPILIIYLKKKCKDSKIYIFPVNEKPSIYEKYKANNINEKNFNSNGINNYQEREVVVDNRSPIQEKGYNTPPNNNFQNYNNNFGAPINFGAPPNFGASSNLGIPPNVVQGASSDTKL